MATNEMAVHTQGSKVWVKDPVEIWIKGEVIKVDGQSVVVKTEGGQEVRVAGEDAPIQNPDVRGGVEVST
jgi:hypothetical protein